MHDISEVPTSELVDELKRRSDTSVILLANIGDSGKREFNYYRDGEIILQLGFVRAAEKTIMQDVVFADQTDED